jgi:hypothetical protein
MFPSAGMVTAVTVTFFVAIGGLELGCGEGDSAEHLTGIFSAAGAFAAFLAGDAVLHNGYNQLCIPLQTDNGELSQCDKETAAVSGENQLLIKQGTDFAGNLRHDFMTAAVANFLYFGTQNHGIQNFYHSGGQTGKEMCGFAVFSDLGIARVNVCFAVFAAQNSSFGKDGKAVQGGGAGCTNHRICQNPVVECNINAVAVTVKGHGLHECLVRLEKSRCRIEITVDVSKLVLEPGFEMSNRNIKAYIEDKYGFKVHDQYIAQIRGKLGLKYHEGYNKTEVHTRKITICPEYKEAAIMDALEYFGCV